VDAGWGPAALGTVCLAGALAVGWTAMRRRAVALLGAIAATTVAAAIVLLTAVFPVAAEVIQVPLRDLSILASRSAGPEGGIAVYGLNKPSVVFYAKRLVTVVAESRQEELGALIREDRTWFVITKAKWRDRLDGLGPVHVVESRGGYLLASNRPPAPGGAVSGQTGGVDAGS
jgi:hypothetical protein